nr:hypothetical protein [Abalone asfa-like virus]
MTCIINIAAISLSWMIIHFAPHENSELQYVRDFFLRDHPAPARVYYPYFYVTNNTSLYILFEVPPHNQKIFYVQNTKEIQKIEFSNVQSVGIIDNQKFSNQNYYTFLVSDDHQDPLPIQNPLLDVLQKDMFPRSVTNKFIEKYTNLTYETAFKSDDDTSSSIVPFLVLLLFVLF